MYLTLEVVSASAALLAGNRQKVFSVEGGRIGRAPENDMVLSGAGVHRQHATVRFINGVFFIEGIGTNGIAVNNPEVIIPRNEPYPISTGDRVFIDELEIAVSISVAAPEEGPVAAAAAPDFGREVAQSTGPFACGPAPVLPDNENAEELDPLRLLSLPGAAAPHIEKSFESAWNHTPSLSDHFRPPTPASPDASMSIPENWDRTTFDRSKLLPLQPVRPTSPPDARQSRVPQPPQPASSAPSAPISAFDWDGFLRAAGVDPATVPPETEAAMGHIMRTVVQGLIEVLRARSEIKTEFRVPVTQVKVSENNPLKFAANVEDALSDLFGRRNPAYLGPQAAFEDAFNDVRFHQLAMLVGVRAGFDSLMRSFDPEQLLTLFEGQGKRGNFLGGAKGRYWRLYTQRFNELTADRDDTFRRLFGDEFARAYEQQLATLKRAPGGTRS